VPALNIRFTDEELDRLRAHARAQNRPVTWVVHDLAVSRSERAQHNDLVMGASARVMALSKDLLERLANR
jgi:hypothetical protein